MANIQDCIQRAVDGQELDPVRGQEAQSEFEQLVARYETHMPRHQAEATAADHLREATRRSARSRRHAVLNQLQSMTRIKALLDESDDPAAALLDALEAMPGSQWNGENVVFLTQALDKRVQADLSEFLRKTGQNVVGRSRNVPLLMDVVRELHLQDTGSQGAKELATAVRKVQKWQRQMFNAHGGDIGEIADYGMRHTHDARAIRQIGFDQWADDIFGQLDWSRITNLDTGRAFADAGAVPDREVGLTFLRKIYDNITTGGWISREPGMTPGGKALYNQRAESRLLHFRDADAWLAYNKQYGQSEPFSSLIGGMQAMNRDIAMMRVFGPNPNSGLEFAKQLVTKRAQTSGDEAVIAKADRAGRRAATIMSHLNGAVNQAEHQGFAQFMSNVRHVNVATKLGSAMLSAVSDTATIATGATIMRMNPANVLSSAVGAVVGANRQQARDMGFVADTLMSIGTSSARLTNDVATSDWASRLSGFTIRASGLSWWTDAMRLGTQMEASAHLARMADQSFDTVDPMWRNLMERNGITEQDWDALRGGGALFEKGGSRFLTPFHWLEHQSVLPRGEAEGLALRLQSSLQDLQELFIPSKRVRGTSFVIGQSAPGTPGGELLRSTGGFKNYAISFTMGQLAAYKALPSPQGRYKHIATLAATTLLMGALAMQLKEISKGRDPRPMDSNKFWLAAALQGGGLGIFGDFVFSEENRFGGGFAQTLAGPTVGMIGDLANPITANTFNALKGEETFLGRDFTNVLRYNTPVASSLWPTRVAFDRLVADQLQLILDPEAERVWRRQEKRLQREYGTRSFWKRGDVLPGRGPDLTNAVGGS